MSGVSRISGIPINDFEIISDQMCLEEAIKSLEKVEYGIIKNESKEIECLVTAEFLTKLLKNIGDNSKKIRLLDLRNHWPPTVIALLTDKETINKNSYSVMVDALIIKAGAKGVIFIRDNQVKGITAFNDLSFTENLKGEVLVTSLDIFDDLSFGGLGGSIGVDCFIRCKICGAKVNYHSYNSEAPPICPRSHEVVL